MPQVLKDDVRDKILDAAVDEFQNNGFEKASMRSIAKNSSMTVGNLYRYFKSKEELSDVIVSPAYNAINGIVERLSGGKVSLGSDSDLLSASTQELRDMLSVMSDSLADIHKKHRAELNILMMGSRLNSELTEWFAGIVSALIAQNFSFDASDDRVRLMSKCYADAIFSGIRTILRNWKGSEEDLRAMIKVYLNSYLSLLDQNISQLI